MDESERPYHPFVNCEFFKGEKNITDCVCYKKFLATNNEQETICYIYAEGIDPPFLVSFGTNHIIRIGYTIREWGATDNMVVFPNEETCARIDRTLEQYANS